MDWGSTIAAFIGGNALGIVLDQWYYSGDVKVNNVVVQLNYSYALHVNRHNLITQLVVDIEFINESGRPKSVTDITFDFYHNQLSVLSNPNSNLPPSVVLPEKEVRSINISLDFLEGQHDFEVLDIEHMYFTIHYRIGRRIRSKTINGTDFKVKGFGSHFV